ncbi:MAG: glycosyltransferase [Desulfovibrio sp.]|jgi:glycosyltransferase involved in cell wall biosynthesis|nr:glycosyltransferase [Desulfovibrio sp.]
MRIFYYLSHYISHRLAGEAYVGLLRELGHTVHCNLAAGSASNLPDAPDIAAASDLTTDQLAFLDKADLVVLHQEPVYYADIFERLPVLRKKTVTAYAVWENEELAPQYRAPLQMVDSVWTCSEFCRRAIAPHVRECLVLPHLVRRGKVSAGDLAWAQGVLFKSREAGAFVFLSVVDAVNPRKNLPALLGAFKLLRRSCRAPTRLLLKQYRAIVPLDNAPDVLNIGENVSCGRMSALYALCDAYVSAHHAEGWGLGISEAMSFGKPAIATGYSGNMEYMNEENSFPVPCSIGPVSAEQCEKIPLFRPGMVWADVDMPALASTMRRVAEGRYAPGLSAHAAAITESFGPTAIKTRLSELLASLPSRP